MKTVTVEGVKKRLTFKTDTGLYTRFTAPSGKSGQYGADIYTIDGDENHLVIVGTSPYSFGLRSTTTVVTAQRYAALAELYDPYNDIAFHEAVMSEIGFS